MEGLEFGPEQQQQDNPSEDSVGSGNTEGNLTDSSGNSVTDSQGNPVQSGDDTEGDNISDALGSTNDVTGW